MAEGTVTDPGLPPQLALHYLRVTFAAHDDDVAMTLYEIDGRGWVYRQFDMRAEGTRFAPEDILMCRPVNLRAMLGHPCAETITAEDFELLWSELAHERSFAARVPDPRIPWEGTLGPASSPTRVRWLPFSQTPVGWTEVPGFLELFVHGDERSARRVCAALFFERAIAWRALADECIADEARWPVAA